MTPGKSVTLGHRFAVELDDDIAGLDARFRRRALLGHFGDDRHIAGEFA